MNGAACFLEGLSLIRKPGLRKYVIVPALINTIILVVMITAGIGYIDAWVTAFVDRLPEWLSFLSWLVWLLAVMVVAMLLLYAFTVIANLIASPFNALLSAAVEKRLTGATPVSAISIWLVLPRALRREWQKMLYMLPMLLGLALLSLIPLLNTLAPAFWVLFGAWMMTVQYVDYAADNNDVEFRDLRHRLGRHRLQAILFGIPVWLLLVIPVLNLVLMPAAVAGATVFWVRRLK